MMTQQDDTATKLRAGGLIVRKNGRRLRRRVRREQTIELAEVTLEARGMSAQKLGAVVRKNAEAIGTLLGCTVTYNRSEYFASGNPAFGNYCGDHGRAGGIYCPATITLTPAS